LLANNVGEGWPLPGRIRKIGCVTCGALLFEKSCAIERLRCGRGYLRVRDFDSRHGTAKSRPDCECRLHCSYAHHRSHGRTLGRREAVVVAGCSVVELKGSRGWDNSAPLDPQMLRRTPPNATGRRIFDQLELQRALCKLRVCTRRWILGAHSSDADQR